MTVDWGSVPEWLSGAGAVAALLFAAVAARAATRANRQQTVQIDRLEQQDTRRAEADRRRQASVVAVWIEAEPGGGPQVRFTNHSGVPVYQVSVFCRCGPETMRTRYTVRGPTTGAVVLTRATTRMNAVLERQGVRSPTQWYRMLGTDRLTVSMSFMDSDGLWWSRSARGTLTRFGARADADASLGTPDDR